MNGALNERRMRRRRGRRGLKRERGLATPLPIHWPIILTNGLCSHRALCFHSLPRWAKIELRPKLLSSVVSRRDPSFSRYFFGGQRRNWFWFVILSNESVERICRIWGKESRVCRLCIEERERKVRARSLVTFRRVERNLLNIVRRKIVFLVEEEGVSRLNIIGRLTLDLIEIPFSSKKGCFDHRENKNSSIFGSMLL